MKRSIYDFGRRHPGLRSAVNPHHCKGKKTNSASPLQHQEEEEEEEKKEEEEEKEEQEQSVLSEMRLGCKCNAEEEEEKCTTER
ncbi:uncharacterized protein LOC144088616 isoform X3 [Stigmatopora argus]